jgi:hypothetical protein
MDEATRTSAQTAATSDAAIETDEPPNDVEDSPAEMERHGKPLASALAYFQDTFATSFAGNDRSAQNQQRRHRFAVRVFSVAGTLAVIFSILHLTRLLALREHPELTKVLALGLFFGEALAVLIALVAVVASMILAFQSNWLETRHKAELFRLLKFSSIIDPTMLSGNDEDFKRWKARLSDAGENIKSTNHESLNEWVEEARIPSQPPPPLTNFIEDQTVKDLLDYYQRKRLDPQTRYFYEQANRNLRWDWSTRLLAPLLFFGSVFFAMLHLIHELLEFYELGRVGYLDKWTHEVSSASVIFIILAGILPVLGAGLRGVRSAYEFSRNTLRFKANHFALELLRERLSTATRPEAILRDLWWCEWMLEAEHREWLRLMIEAEWIG